MLSNLINQLRRVIRNAGADGNRENGLARSDELAYSPSEDGELVRDVSGDCGLSFDIHEGMLPSSSDPANLGFEPEMSAESFFIDTHGEMASGNFAPVGNREISFIDAHWELEDVQTPGGSTKANRSQPKAMSLSGLRAAVKRVRTEADQKRLLSPKSAVALAKLESGRAKLNASDENALTHLLNRLRGNEHVASDVLVLSMHLLDSA